MAVGSSAAACRKSRAAASRSPRRRALVGLAAPEVGEHRVGPQGDGAAVGLDRAERLVVAQRGVAAGQQRAVVALPGGGLVGDGAADGGQASSATSDQSARFN